MCAGLTHHVIPDRLKTISESIPKVLIITGDQDHLVPPSNSKYLKEHMSRAEFIEWEKAGAVTIKRAFSRTPEKSDGSKYVQDIVWADRLHFLQLWREGAQLYICGSRKVSQGIEKVIKNIRQEESQLNGEILSDEEAKKWWDELRNIRYATDVFD